MKKNIQSKKQRVYNRSIYWYPGKYPEMHQQESRPGTGVWNTRHNQRETSTLRVELPTSGFTEGPEVKDLVAPRHEREGGKSGERGGQWDGVFCKRFLAENFLENSREIVVRLHRFWYQSRSREFASEFWRKNLEAASERSWEIVLTLTRGKLFYFGSCQCLWVLLT